MCVGDLQAPMHTRALATLKVQRVKTQLQRGKQYILHTRKPTRSSVLASFKSLKGLGYLVVYSTVLVCNLSLCLMSAS